MPLTKVAQKLVTAAMLRVPFDTMYITVGEHETVVKMHKGKEVMAIRRCSGMQIGDTLCLTGLEGVIPTKLTFE